METKGMMVVVCLALALVFISSVLAVPADTQAAARAGEQDNNANAGERKQWHVDLEQTSNKPAADIENETKVLGLENALSHVTNENALARIRANILKLAACDGKCSLDINATVDGSETKIKKTVPGRFLGLFKVNQTSETTLDAQGNVAAQKKNGWQRFGFLVKDE